MKKLSLLLVLALIATSAVWAQNEVKPAKFENVTWHRVVLVDFKPGKVGRAKEIIKTYKAAGNAAGLKNPQSYWLMSGEYDMMTVWTMEGGLSDMEWDVSPDGIKWRAEMVKKLGSEEAVRKLQQEFQDLQLSSTSHIARKEI